MTTLPDKMEETLRNATDEWLETRGFTRDELRGHMERRVERDQAKSPNVGDPAPNFDLALIGAGGELTGARLQLSSLAGRPVGLLFGSFT